MSEWRKDPFSDRWVIVADQRSGRPNDFQSTFQRRPDATCPFCAGRESSTPDPVLVLRDPEAADDFAWHVRVVPNRYPALSTDSGPPNASLPDASENLCQRRHLAGLHEVVIESPEHRTSLLELSHSRLVLCWEAFRQRLHLWRSQGTYSYGLMFKNFGPLGGASLEHLHSQLIALSIVPPERQQIWDNCREWQRRRQQCLFCEWLDRELSDRVRVLASTERFLAVCPFASRLAYQTWIVRRDHGCAFEDASLGELREFGQILRKVLDAQQKILGTVSYNLILHAGPFDSPDCNHYHWYVETFPRLAIMAGFEWGSGYFINTVAPERAAAALRSGMSDEISDS